MDFGDVAGGRNLIESELKSNKSPTVGRSVQGGTIWL